MSGPTMSRRSFLLAGAATTGLVAIGGAAAVKAVPLLRSYGPLDPWVRERMRLATLPGLGAAVVRKGRAVWSRGWGWADVDARTPATRDTVFMLASVSKTVTCAGVMRAVQGGSLSLDEDINGVLPFDVRHPEFPSVPITLRMLLTHTSGLRDRWSAILPDYVQGDSPLALGAYMQDYFTPDGTRYDAKNFEEWKPGEKYDYSNMAVSLAGYCAEVATGVPFDQWCRQEIFAPLGMDETSWHLQGLDVADVAVPYHYDKQHQRYRAIPHYGYPDYPDGQLRTTPAQLGTFLAAMSGGGATADGVRILEQATIDEIFTNQQVASWRQGLIWYGSGNRATGPLWGHNGGDKGVATYMFLSPATGDGVVLLANGGWRGWSQSHAYRQIRDRLLTDPPV